MSIPEGYHPRESGAESHCQKQTCDSCGSTVRSTYGFERDWPKDEDLWVCWQCYEGWLEEHGVEAL